jgi:iron complex transport system substrate-binding protein
LAAVRVDEPVRQNLTAASVAEFRPGVDYFPEKAQFLHSKQLEVTYHGNYKRVRFRPSSAAEVEDWYLVQRGTPAPDIPKEAKLVWVPAQRLAIGTYRYGGAIELLGVASAIVAYGNHRNATVPSLLERLKDGRLGRNYTTELVGGLEVDAVLNYYSNAELLRDATAYDLLGVTSIGMAEHMEPDALARAEWVKFFAMLFNKEAQANEIFNGVADRYTRMRELASRVTDRPEVIVNNRSGARWMVYGSENVAAQLIRDAGGTYVWNHIHNSLSQMPVPLELAWERGFAAPVWLLGADFSGSRELDQNLSKDRYTRELAAFRGGRTFACANLDNENRNIWWDWGSSSRTSIWPTTSTLFIPSCYPITNCVSTGR